MDQRQSFYRRHLPHYHPAHARLFVTFRLAGSLPRSVVEQLQVEADNRAKTFSTIADGSDRYAAIYTQETRIFGRWDHYLDLADHGPTWLAKPAVAEIVIDAMQYRDGTEYGLNAYCIMPNHVHMIIQSISEDGQSMPLTKIMQSLKRYTARQANIVLNRRGPFWQAESYDHVIRDADEFDRINHYVQQNPVKAGLVRQAEDWPWTFP